MDEYRGEYSGLPEPEDDTQGIIIIDEPCISEPFIQIPLSVYSDPDLSLAAKMTYIGLLRYAWQKGSCFPGQRTLAKDMAVSLRTVNRAVLELKQKDWITVTRRGMGRSNTYRLARWVSRNAKLTHQDTTDLAHHDTSDWRREEYSWKNTKGRRPIESKGHLPKIAEENRQAIASYITDFAAEFNDQASIESSTARAVNCFIKANIPIEDFIEAMYEARKKTKASLFNVKKKGGNGKKTSMAYWFSALEALIQGQ